MNAPRIASLVAVLVVTAPLALVAQQEPPVAPGDRVRVSAPSVVEMRVVGFVASLDRDTLVLNAEGGAVLLTVPFASVTALEVYRGRKSRVWQRCAHRSRCWCRSGCHRWGISYLCFLY
jgi:hypothetical protein